MKENNKNLKHNNTMHNKTPDLRGKTKGKTAARIISQYKVIATSNTIGSL